MTTYAIYIDGRYAYTSTRRLPEILDWHINLELLDIKVEGKIIFFRTPAN